MNKECSEEQHLRRIENCTPTKLVAPLNIYESQSARLSSAISTPQYQNNSEALVAKIARIEECIELLERKYTCLLSTQNKSDLPLLTLALSKLSSQIDDHTADLIAVKTQEICILKGQLSRKF